MPSQSSRRSFTAEKESSEIYSFCDSLDSIILPAAFFSVNLVAFMVRLDLATMMVVPNLFFLFQMRLIDYTKGFGMSLLAIGLMAAISTDSFYILVTHCLFYLTILLVSSQIQDYKKV